MTHREVWVRLAAFVYGELGVAEFVDWIDDNQDVDGVLDARACDELADFDYESATEQSARLHVRIVCDWYANGAVGHARARAVAASIVNGTQDLVDACRNLVRLRHEGVQCVPLALAAIDAQLDDVPSVKVRPLWDPAALAEKLRGIEPQLRTIVSAAEQMLAAMADTDPVFPPSMAAPGPDPVLRFEIPGAMLEKLREQDSHVEYRDDVADREAAFMLDGGLGPTRYLTTDGRVLIDNRGWDETSIREASVDEAIAAIVIGARTTGIAELLDLLPPRPAGAADCPRCNGKRWMSIGNDMRTGEPAAIICISCSGRGWHVAADT